MGMGQLGRFDAAIAIGLIHHLDDEEASDLAATTAALLKPHGRFVTLDPGRSAGQPWIARWLVERDRGQWVRAPDGYRALAARHFGTTELSVHYDLARLPYPHVVLICRQPMPEGRGNE